MTLAIFTHVPHLKDQNKYFAYAPYVFEMNIWSKYADCLLIVGPLSLKSKSNIDIEYDHPKINFKAVQSFNLLSLKSICKALIDIPIILIEIFLAMKQADHIHLRCPGNMGLLACIVQIFFPRKIKTAKYAGNWDPAAKKPFSYALQAWILSNTFLTKNMQVLVYGEWDGSTQNIKPFFTATYSESEKHTSITKDLKGTFNFIFVGALVLGKRPLYAIELVESLLKKNYDVVLNLYGDGPEREKLERYISENYLTKFIFIKGNQSKETLKQAYQESHFTILPSVSEGWPKAIAEGMFWGAVPIATKVSCVPYILGFGERGILLEEEISQDVIILENLIKDKKTYLEMSEKARSWSQKYSTDLFECEIKKILV